MANTRKLTKGLEILLKYYDNPEGYHVYAEHDQILFADTDREISDEDMKVLTEYGFYTEDEDQPKKSLYVLV